MICDMDCFNCKYDECINDTITQYDIEQAKQLDSEIKFSNLDNHGKHKKIVRDRITKRNYNSILESNRKWRARNRKKEQERNRANYLKHKQSQEFVE